MEYLFIAVVVFFIIALGVRVGVDSSKNAQYTKELLKELREMKELLQKGE
ncbi:hypothetical protein [Paenibacillus radicis (ex Gao et al. 2016)]|uniref:Uncharacterized protein n=1 Tax=Paenibacillus radicis (ex Gao et al. 2016) TaxID=1737354 RepID=A0A917LVU3_9BACL|nr:hypothetical protein [Paenibacillus radicis (ex Gao et al. 2016)]GGG61037.1 hypothetical protein GCM10010918_13010 [Paenibacillus radicis (ex Gao et al. 2016)]